METLFSCYIIIQDQNVLQKSLNAFIPWEFYICGSPGIFRRRVRRTFAAVDTRIFWGESVSLRRMLTLKSSPLTVNSKEPYLSSAYGQ